MRCNVHASILMMAKFGRYHIQMSFGAERLLVNHSLRFCVGVAATEHLTICWEFVDLLEELEEFKKIPSFSLSLFFG